MAEIIAENLSSTNPPCEAVDNIQTSVEQAIPHIEATFEGKGKDSDDTTTTLVFRIDISKGYGLQDGGKLGGGQNNAFDLQLEETDSKDPSTQYLELSFNTKDYNMADWFCNIVLFGPNGNGGSLYTFTKKKVI